MTTAVEMVADAKARIDNVSPADAFAEVSAGAAALVDVREPVEWERHIAGAVQVPRGLLEFSADPTNERHLAELDPTKRVIVYCRSGSRSALAVRTLEALGYRNVANLDGGFNAWHDAGLPIVEHHAAI